MTDQGQVLRARATRCRDLAATFTDPRTIAILERAAADYEREAQRSGARPRG